MTDNGQVTIVIIKEADKTLGITRDNQIHNIKTYSKNLLFHKKLCISQNLKKLTCTFYWGESSLIHYLNSLDMIWCTIHEFYHISVLF